MRAYHDAGLLDLEHEARASTTSELLTVITELIEAPPNLWPYCHNRLRIFSWELRRRLVAETERAA